MNNHKRPEEAAAIVGLFFVAAYLLLCVVVEGQSTPSPELMLARSCVSERGWRTETDDCAGIASVVRRRMARTGETWRRALRALAPRLHGTAPLGRRAWLRGLDEDGEQPEHWPRGPSWATHRDAWIATLEEARGLIDEPATRCAEEPSAWGSVDDVRRRESVAVRWVDVDCGVTLNRFGYWLRRM